MPATVTIKAGDTVKWTNPYNISHTVTFDPAKAANKDNVVLPAGVEPFDSGAIEEEGTFSHTFTAKGPTNMSASITKPWAWSARSLSPERPAQEGDAP